MREFVDEHRQTFGVEPICKVMQIAPSGYWQHAARQRDPTRQPARMRRDQALMPHIDRVFKANMQVYGADKVWKQLNREHHVVARCTVERLMRRLGCAGSSAAK